mgnify:CR=1 FL=1
MIAPRARGGGAAAGGGGGAAGGAGGGGGRSGGEFESAPATPACTTALSMCVRDECMSIWIPPQAAISRLFSSLAESFRSAPATRALYIVDTGHGRVVRMDPDSGRFLRSAKREHLRAQRLVAGPAVARRPAPRPRDPSRPVAPVQPNGHDASPLVPHGGAQEGLQEGHRRR